MLYGASRLGRHDVAQASIIRRRRSICYRKIPPSVVAVKEDGDIVDPTRAIITIWREIQFAVGCYIESYLDSV